MSAQLVSEGVHWADALLLEEDSRIFGFGSGWLTLTQEPVPSTNAALCEWMEQQGCEVAGVSVPVSRPDALLALQQIGFRCIDMNVKVSLLNVKRRPRTISGASVRLAGAEDFASVEEIAGTSFDFGRYHRDVRFPRHLADARFAHWIAASLRNPESGTCCYVTGEVGSPVAFMLTQVTGRSARWHLGGVSRTSSNGLIGPLMFAGVMDVLEAQGVRSVVAKVSAANTPVVNIYTALGFHVSEPEFTLHFHSPSSTHLIS